MASVAASGMHKVFVGGESVDMTTEGLAVFMGALLDREGAPAPAEELVVLRRELAELKVEVRALHEKVAFLEGEAEEGVPAPTPEATHCCGKSGKPTGLMSPSAKALLYPTGVRGCGDCE